MKPIHIFAACAAALGLVAAGCGNKSDGYQAKPMAKVEPLNFQAGQEKNLFPMTVGSQWVYTVEAAVRGPQGSGGDRGEVTLLVKSVKDVPGGKRAEIDIIRNDQVQERTIWMVNDKGIYQVSSGRNNVLFNPPQLQFSFPYEKGKTFLWEGTGSLPDGGTGRMKVKSRILGEEEVDTETGRVSAIAVQSMTTWRNAQGVDMRMIGMSWWKPNEGLVRVRQELASPNGQSAVQLLRLKSSTLK